MTFLAQANEYFHAFANTKREQQRTPPAHTRNPPHLDAPLCLGDAFFLLPLSLLNCLEQVWFFMF